MALWLQILIASSPTIITLLLGVLAIARLEFRSQNQNTRIGTLETNFQNHQLSTTIHVDPNRDGERWERLYKELDELKREMHQLNSRR